LYEYLVVDSLPSSDLTSYRTHSHPFFSGYIFIQSNYTHFDIVKKSMFFQERENFAVIPLEVFMSCGMNVSQIRFSRCLFVNRDYTASLKKNLTREPSEVLKSFWAQILSISREYLDQKQPKRIWAQVEVWLRYRSFTRTCLWDPIFPIKSKFQALTWNFAHIKISTRMKHLQSFKIFGLSIPTI
jgi:hypothetical protein